MPARPVPSRPSLGEEGGTKTPEKPRSESHSRTANADRISRYAQQFLFKSRGGVDLRKVDWDRCAASRHTFTFTSVLQERTAGDPNAKSFPLSGPGN